jgi:ankyrin repeat protein
MMSVADPGKVKLLIERGADVNEKASGGVTALIAAAPLRSNTEAVRLLLSAGADASVTTPSGEVLQLRSKRQARVTRRN